METNPLSVTLAAALNSQITREAYASQFYLSYATWAESQGLSGIGAFVFQHAMDERNHMLKIMQYILQRGSQVVLETVPASPPHPDSIHDCVVKAFEQEVEKTKAVYAIMKMSFQEEDWATWNFIRWFIRDQIKEEMLAMNLIHKLKFSGDEKLMGKELVDLDKDMVREGADAQTETGLNDASESGLLNFDPAN